MATQEADMGMDPDPDSGLQTFDTGSGDIMGVKGVRVTPPLISQGADTMVRCASRDMADLFSDVTIEVVINEFKTWKVFSTRTALSMWDAGTDLVDTINNIHHRLQGARGPALNLLLMRLLQVSVASLGASAKPFNGDVSDLFPCFYPCGSVVVGDLTAWARETMFAQPPGAAAWHASIASEFPRLSGKFVITISDLLRIHASEMGGVPANSSVVSTVNRVINFETALKAVTLYPVETLNETMRRLYDAYATEYMKQSVGHVVLASPNILPPPTLDDVTPQGRDDSPVSVTIYNKVCIQFHPTSRCVSKVFGTVTQPTTLTVHDVYKQTDTASQAITPEKMVGIILEPFLRTFGSRPKPGLHTSAGDGTPPLVGLHAKLKALIPRFFTTETPQDITRLISGIDTKVTTEPKRTFPSINRSQDVAAAIHAAFRALATNSTDAAMFNPYHFTLAAFNAPGAEDSIPYLNEAVTGEGSLPLLMGFETRGFAVLSALCWDCCSWDGTLKKPNTNQQKRALFERWAALWHLLLCDTCKKWTTVLPLVPLLRLITVTGNAHTFHSTMQLMTDTQAISTDFIQLCTLMALALRRVHGAAPAPDMWERHQQATNAAFEEAPEQWIDTANTFIITSEENGCNSLQRRLAEFATTIAPHVVRRSALVSMTRETILAKAEHTRKDAKTQFTTCLLDTVTRDITSTTVARKLSDLPAAFSKLQAVNRVAMLDQCFTSHFFSMGLLMPVEASPLTDAEFEKGVKASIGALFD